MPEQSFCDYYENLQISANADLETIERVYRLLAKKYHTDNRSTGNVEKFDLINTAYKVLSNPEKRAAYDAHYEESKNHQWKAISKVYASEGFEIGPAYSPNHPVHSLHQASRGPIQCRRRYRAIGEFDGVAGRNIGFPCLVSERKGPD